MFLAEQMGRKVKDGAGHGCVPDCYVEAEALTSRERRTLGNSGDDGGAFHGLSVRARGQDTRTFSHEVDTARQQ